MEAVINSQVVVPLHHQAVVGGPTVRHDGGLRLHMLLNHRKQHVCSLIQAQLKTNAHWWRVAPPAHIVFWLSQHHFIYLHNFCCWEIYWCHCPGDGKKYPVFQRLSGIEGNIMCDKCKIWLKLEKKRSGFWCDQRHWMFKALHLPESQDIPKKECSPLTVNPLIVKTVQFPIPSFTLWMQLGSTFNEVNPFQRL